MSTSILAQDNTLVTQTGLHYFAIEDLTTGRVVLRGQAGSNGVAHPPRSLILGSNRPYRHWILQAQTLLVGHSRFNTPRSGEVFELGDIVLGTALSEDSDTDGLHDEGELVMGTNPLDPDTDHDGVPDGTEVRQGANPSDGVAIQTGLIASFRANKTALDVEATDDLAIVCQDTDGIAIFNIFDGLQPVLLGQVDTPRNAIASASWGDYIAVADSQGGLAIVDITRLQAGFVRHSVNLGSSVITVVAYCGEVLAGTLDGRLVRVDLATGAILDTLDGFGAVHDLALFEDHLFVLSSSHLIIFDADLNHLTEVGRISVPLAASPLEVGRKLFVGGQYAYVGYFRGYSVIDITDPGAPIIVGSPPSSQEAINHIASNGAGLTVATTSTTGPSTLAFSIYDASDPTDVNELLNSFNLPGDTRGFALYNGYAYVAGSIEGLQVLNFISPDTQGLPPSIILAANQVGPQIEERAFLRISARAVDDVQVRNVEFYLNDSKVATDGNFPFEYRLKVPFYAAGADLKIQARAVDMAGNANWSGPLFYTISPNQTDPPQVLGFYPGNEVTLDEVNQISVTFNKSMDASTATQASLIVSEAGPDGNLGTADDLTQTLDQITMIDATATLFASTTDNLPSGLYRVEATSATRDLTGNGLAQPFVFSFTIRATKVRSFQPANTTTLDQLDRILVSFTRALDPATLDKNSLQLTEAGPDGIFANGDDELIQSGTLGYLPSGYQALRTFQGGLKGGKYQIQTTPALKDAQGDSVLNDSSFFTITHPQILEMSPSSGSVLDNLTNLTIRFSKDMDPNSMTHDHVTLVEAGPDGVFDSLDDLPITGGNLTYDTGQRLVLLSFANGLASGSYRFSASAGVSDTSGTPIAPGSSAFSIRPPTVLTKTPTPGAILASIAYIEASFNRPMDPTSLNAASVTLTEAGVDGLLGTADDSPKSVSILVAPDGLSIRLTPTDPLTSGLYQATLFSSVRDLFATTLAADVFWQFQIKKLLITSTSPNPGAIVDEVSQIQASFNLTLDPLSVNTSSFLLTNIGADLLPDTADDYLIEGGLVTLSSAQKVVTLSFEDTLPPGTYRAVFTTDVQSDEGVALLLPYHWDFRIPGLRVLSVAPADSAIEDVLYSISVNFNHPIDPNTLVAETLSLKEWGPDNQFDTPDDRSITDVRFLVTNNSQQATMRFEQGLPSGIFRATVSSGILDFNGSSVENPQSWTFEVTPSRVLGSSVSEAEFTNQIREIHVYFEKPMSERSVIAGLSLTSAGPDNLLNTNDDSLVTTGFASYRERTGSFDLPQGLPSGLYRFDVAATVVDAFDHPILEPFSLSFTNLGGAEIEGTVVDPLNQPLNGVTLELHPFALSKRIDQVTSDGLGHFTFYNVDPSPAGYRVVAKAQPLGQDHRAEAEVVGLASDVQIDVGTLTLFPYCQSSPIADLFPDEAHGLDGPARALAVFDSGAGPALFVAGRFLNAAGQPAANIARWDGSNILPVGDGLDDQVEALVAFDDGSGPALYAAGRFRHAGALSAEHIARWDGLAWQPLGSGLNNTVECLISFDDGSGPALYAGGSFTQAGGVPANRVARWRAGAWENLGDGLDGVVYAMAVHNDGTGDHLYLAGSFFYAAAVEAANIVRWDGNNQWTPLAEGLNGTVYALANYDDGAGNELYVGGELTPNGPNQEQVLGIAKWNGLTWSGLGRGVSEPLGGGGHKREGQTVFATPGAVTALKVFDDGTGPGLYLCGNFSQVGTHSSLNLAKWQHATWWPAQAGITYNPDPSSEPYAGQALEVFSHNGTPALFLGGSFTEVDYLGAAYLAALACAPTNKSSATNNGSSKGGL